MTQSNANSGKSDQTLPPRKRRTLGGWLVSGSMFVLMGLGLHHHFGHLPKHIQATGEFLQDYDFAKSVPTEVNVAPILGAGFFAHVIDAPKHGADLFTEARDDLAAAHKEHGTLKMLAGIGLLLIFIAWFVSFGVYWWPLVVGASWIGRIAWTAVFTGLFGVCLKLKDLWEGWNPNMDAAPNAKAA